MRKIYRHLPPTTAIYRHLPPPPSTAIYRQIGSRPQKFEIWTFSQIHPMTFGLCLVIITDTFHWVFEYVFPKFIFHHFFDNLSFKYPNNPSNILENCLKVAKMYLNMTSKVSIIIYISMVRFGFTNDTMVA